VSDHRVRDEPRQAEEALASLRRQYELILNSAGEGIYGLDLEGNINFINPKADELLGWKRGELLGKPAHATIHHTKSDGSNYPIESCPIHASMRVGATQRVTNDVLWRKDGTSFRVDYVCAPIKNKRSDVTGAIVTFKDITEQFAAEMRLKLQEQQYRLLFETNPSPMWVFATETLQILAVNEAAIVQYGYSRDEFLKLNLKDLRPPGDVPDLFKARALSSPQQMSHYSGQFRHLRKDGSLILAEIYSGPIVWAGVAARIVTAIDVTERKWGEEALRQAEEKYRSIFENAVEGIFQTTPEGRYISVNPALARMYGYDSPEELMASVNDIGHLLYVNPERRTEFKRLIEAQGFVERFEYEVYRKDGSRIWVSENARAARDASGAVIYYEGTVQDITERKRAEERSREQADIINRAHDIVVIRNFGDDRIMFWNSGAERVYGWSAEEAIGRPMGELIFTEENNRAALVEQLLATGEFHGEIKHRTKDGREVIVNSHVTLIRNEDGTPRSVLGIGTDVTEQKSLETQLLRAQRLESIGTLASGVAHDLNNILTPILMCAQALRGELGKEDRQSAIALIEKSAQRGAGVVKQVLTFARGVEGERVLIKPSYLIEEMVDIARQTFPKSIEVSSRYPEDLWSIEGDPTQLHQVLLNICVNARDAMPSGGALVIAADNFNVDEHYASMTPEAKVGPFVALRVSDTGAGMPRVTIDKIFDPFFTTKEVGKGTGLGLSTTLGIVKSHGGFISVYSEPGEGTTFKLFLPAATHEDLQASKTSAVLIQGNGDLILVVDDEPAILSITKIILEQNNYRVVSASDGPAALAIFAQQMHSIHVLLTDMSMPYMDGMALIRAIRKMKSDLPIIASTGQGEQEHVNERQSLGVHNFLTKPYNAEQLLATIHAVVEGRSGESPGIETE
jgi:PAS domain S-box-containing protein